MYLTLAAAAYAENYTPHTVAADGRFIRAHPAPGADSSEGASRTSTYISRAPISRALVVVDAGPGRGGRGLETISISFIVVASRRRRRRRRRLRVRTRAGGVYCRPGLIALVGLTPLFLAFSRLQSS